MYDAASDSVVEVGTVRVSASAAEAYDTAARDYRDQQNTYASPIAGERLTQAALVKAVRREWAHRKYGSEHRWAE